MGLTKLVLRRPVSTFLVMLGIVVFGFFSIFQFNLELYPNISMPMMMVMTVYPGASPESIEQIITREVEDAGEALSGVASCSSYSYENYSMVVFSYDYEMDMNDAYTDLSAALDLLKLPDDAQDPTIMMMDFNALDTVTISCSNDGSSDMMAYIRDTMKPKMEAVSNVAKVNITGGKENYIRVQLNEEKMKQYGLDSSMIAGFVGAADYNIPVGQVSAGSQDVSVSASSSFLSLEDLKNTKLMTKTGTVLTLGDVAEISMRAKDAESISRYNGEQTVTVGVIKNQNAATVKVAKAIKKALKQLEDADPGVKFTISYDAGDAIIDSLKSVAETLVFGVLLAMVVLFVFFGDFKASMIVGSSIPFSVLATMVMMNLIGYDMNIVTMGALVIAIGMIVDNSIVVIESCYRKLDEKGDYEISALEGTGIVMMSIVASTITTIVVYLPMSLIKGMAGQMFSQFGFIIVFAMLSSLVSAICVVPLFFTKLRPTERKESIVNRILDVIKDRYDGLMRVLLRHKVSTILICVAMLIGTFFLASTLDFELIPTTYDGSIKITSTFRSGTKLEKMDEIVAPIEEKVANDPNFKSYTINITENKATINAQAKSGCKRTSEEGVEEYQQEFAEATNMDVFVEPSGGGSMDMGAMTTNFIEVVLESTDLDALTKGAAQLENMMKKTPGVIHVTSDAAAAQTGAHIVIDPLTTTAKGLTPVQVAGDLYSALSGTKVGTMEIDREEYEIRMHYPKEAYDDINKVMNKTISTQMGSTVSLSDIAHVEYDEQLQSIHRSNGKYMVTVSATAEGDIKSQVKKKITANAEKLDYPKGVAVSQSMMQEIMVENLSAILYAILSGVFLVFLVMAMQFESPRFSLMVMACIPFALIGSFPMLVLGGNSLNMVSMMGFLMLMGIVVNNGILLVDTANQNRETMPVTEALIEAGKVRLRPILMTTLTTILAMVPMAFFSNDKMMQGMSFVIIGGLVASTLLCLLMMPTCYLLLDKEERKAKKKSKKSKKMKSMKKKPKKGNKVNKAGKKNIKRLSDNDDKDY